MIITAESRTVLDTDGFMTTYLYYMRAEVVNSLSFNNAIRVCASETMVKITMLRPTDVISTSVENTFVVLRAKFTVVNRGN